MVSWWDKRALNISKLVSLAESEYIEQLNEKDVQKSIIAARRDISGIYVQLSCINEQLNHIKGFLFLVTILGLITVYHHW